jgi:hypothetical protein
MTPQAFASERFPEANIVRASSGDISKTRLWTGRVLSGLVVAFMVMDGVMKLFKPAFVVQATIQLGYPESTIVGIGITLLACTLLYVIPRTSILGAILLTGYLGGAVASGVRASTPLFNIVFPIVFGGIAWLGIWLRDQRLRELVPFSGK